MPRPLSQGNGTRPAARVRTFQVKKLSRGRSAGSHDAAPKDVRFVQLGQSASPTATLQSGWVRGRMMNILGFTLFATPYDVIADGYRQLAEHVRDGRIEFRVESFALDAVSDAWQRQASGSPGSKIVVSLAG